MIRACAQCGQRNRVGPEHLADTGRCGSCKATLPPVSEPLPVTAAEFDEIVGKSKVPVLVDFWAAWCGPCRAAAPEVTTAANAMAGKVIVLKVDTEREQALAARYRIQSIPNFMVFRGGAPVRQQPGMVRSDVLTGWLREVGA